VIIIQNLKTEVIRAHELYVFQPIHFKVERLEYSKKDWNFISIDVIEKRYYYRNGVLHNLLGPAYIYKSSSGRWKHGWCDNGTEYDNPQKMPSNNILVRFENWLDKILCKIIGIKN
jgi:hypothetical protein